MGMKCLSTCTSTSTCTCVFRPEWLSDQNIVFLSMGENPNLQWCMLEYSLLVKACLCHAWKRKPMVRIRLKKNKKNTSTRLSSPPRMESLYSNEVLTFGSSTFVTQGHVCHGNKCRSTGFKITQISVVFSPYWRSDCPLLGLLLLFTLLWCHSLALFHNNSTNIMLKPCSFSTPPHYDCFKAAWNVQCLCNVLM